MKSVPCRAAVFDASDGGAKQVSQMSGDKVTDEARKGQMQRGGPLLPQGVDRLFAFRLWNRERRKSLARSEKTQVPFGYAQGRLSTPLRFAQNDSKDGARGFRG